MFLLYMLQMKVLAYEKVQGVFASSRYPSLLVVCSYMYVHIRY